MSSQPATHRPLLVILSGKRKTGKDYLADRLLAELGVQCHPPVATITRLSAPLKRAYARDHQLDYARLLDASAYKESHRAAMVTWGEEQRSQDPGFFCRLAVEEVPPREGLLVVIISDARRTSDLTYFVDQYGRAGCCLIRISASETCRRRRGWEFVAGIDDGDTECGLDGWLDWDVEVENGGAEGLSAGVVDGVVARIVAMRDALMGRRL